MRGPCCQGPAGVKDGGSVQRTVGKWPQMPGQDNRHGDLWALVQESWVSM